MNKISFLFLATILALSLTSCEQEHLAVPPIETNQFWTCHTAQNLDSIKLASSLLGSWKWKKQFCYWSGKTTYADMDVQITFSGLGIYTVRENSGLPLQGTWKLKAVDSNMFELDLERSCLYLHGIILLCNDEVIFSDSYIDGCDNLFTK